LKIACLPAGRDNLKIGYKTIFRAVTKIICHATVSASGQLHGEKSGKDV
jgi:hypothetical protein